MKILFIAILLFEFESNDSTPNANGNRHHGMGIRRRGVLGATLCGVTLAVETHPEALRTAGDRWVPVWGLRVS